MELKDGVPCRHPGCLNHVSHPREGCGRIAGKSPAKNTRATDPLLKEMAEALELVKDVKEINHRDRGFIDQVLQKYRDQHPTPSPPLDGDC